MVHSRLKTIKEDNEKEQLLKILKNYMKHSYLLLEKIKNDGKGFADFLTSRIVFSEVFSVIGDEYRSRILLEQGVPLRYWMKMIFDLDISEGYLAQILEEFDNFNKIFLVSKKLHPLSDFNSEDVGVLIWGYKCNTMDAIILAQAIKGNCNYFITEDQRLRERLKPMKEYDIELYSSERYSQEFIN